MIGENSRRDAFVNWIISSKNERFSRVVANRIWKKIMGRGVFEPVDDVQSEMEISNPELLNYLENEIRGLGFDLKQFQRIILNTRTYHRSMTRRSVELDEP